MWLAGKAGLAPKSHVRYAQCLPHLKAEFGERLACDVDCNEIAEYQRKRPAAGVSNRSVNYEVAALAGLSAGTGFGGRLRTASTPCPSVMM